MGRLPRKLNKEKLHSRDACEILRKDGGRGFPAASQENCLKVLELVERAGELCLVVSNAEIQNSRAGFAGLSDGRVIFPCWGKLPAGVRCSGCRYLRGKG
jgi:hypothetical protein